MANVITFPHIGHYHVPITFLVSALFNNCAVQPAPPITKKTLELGSKYSPDFVCTPFKYNLGNYIEALDNGANVLIQAGGGCRYGFYGEVQEQILRDLGYDFKFICLIGGNLKLRTVFDYFRKLGCTVPFPKFLHYLLLSYQMVKIMDQLEFEIRKNIGFEVEKNSFENLYEQFLNDLQGVTGFQALHNIHKAYRKKLRAVEIRKPEHCLKVGLVGELYTLMEPFSNFFIEKELAKYHIEVTRYINASYLLFQKDKNSDKTLRSAGKYLKYKIGADGTDSVADSKKLAERGYDGIIHIKPFGCTPEINAMPMLQNIGADYQIPILYFSFDAQTSETGIRTRLEAFNDMLVMRNRKKSMVKRGAEPCGQDI